MADLELTKEQVIAVCPDPGLSSITDDQWAMIFESVEAEINTRLEGFGNVKRAQIAARYLAAHKALKLLQQANGSGGGSGSELGPLSSVTVGPITKTYGSTTEASAGAGGDDPELRTTQPGREFLRLRRQWAGRWLVVG